MSLPSHVNLAGMPPLFSNALLDILNASVIFASLPEAVNLKKNRDVAISTKTKIIFVVFSFIFKHSKI